MSKPSDSVTAFTRYPESPLMNGGLYRHDERTARRRERPEAPFIETAGQPCGSKPLQVFGGRKRDTRSTSCKPGRQESNNLSKKRSEGTGIEAFHEMFVTSRRKFVGIAHAILRNREDAEDAVQNAFLSGHRHLGSFEGRSALTTWFTRIVLNAALMIQRKQRLSRIRPVPEAGISDEANWMEQIPTSQPDPEVVHDERERLQVINELLAKMKPTLRQAFTMAYYDELSAREACARLGISAGTFKARLFRARRFLASHAQHSLVAPIRKRLHSAFFPPPRVLLNPLQQQLRTSRLLKARSHDRAAVTPRIR